MNARLMWHLSWKEYRAVRAFWMAMVLMVIGADLLIVALSREPGWTTSIVYHFALAAPAFFALGTAGAAFAVEQEEGTFEFLRAVPVTARQILASKLGLAVAATLAMYLLLWPAAWLLLGGKLPEAADLQKMLGLWLVAAIEALAWGTLFSLLSARPLLAITLALFTTSTVTHLLAWSTISRGPTDTLNLEPYLAAAPLRLLVAALVLSVDAALAMRWLDGLGPVATPEALRFRRPNLWTFRYLKEATGWSSAATVDAIARRRDRSAVYVRLLWQHWRQSLCLMLAMLVVGMIATPLMMAIFHSLWGDLVYILIPFAATACLMGNCVFLPDKERSRLRFFVEHNVPPRAVWWTRQVPWLFVLLAWAVLGLLGWLALDDTQTLIRALYFGTRLSRVGSMSEHDFYENLRLAQTFAELQLGLAIILTAYAAGQWASMIVRSGLLSAFFGLLLGAALCGWVLLMHAMELDYLWTVLPIPLVLLFATWLRAPDWIRENTSWAARLRTATVVAVPALVLMIGVPYHRAHEIGRTAPGFSPDSYLAEITPEAKATADLYRKANDRLVLAPEPIVEEEKPKTTGELTAQQLAWLKENAEPLALMLAASQRKDCALVDPATMTEPGTLRNASALVTLLITDGRRLESEGQLDLALDRYFSALRAIAHWNHFEPFPEIAFRVADANRVFAQITAWSARAGQTPERLAGAITRLEAFDSAALRPDDADKTNYLTMRRYLLGDDSVQSLLYPKGGPSQSEVLWRKLMPWEAKRELDTLNWVTHRTYGEHQARTPEYYPTHLPWVKANPLMVKFNMDMSHVFQRVTDFEVHRRATILILALEAYRLRHGQLPDSLDALVGAELKTLPVDPYSRWPFRYFPHGFPKPISPLDEQDVREGMRNWEYRKPSPDFDPAMPLIWSTGPSLYAHEITRPREVDAAGEALPAPPPSEQAIYYSWSNEYSYNGQRLPLLTALYNGRIFPIPAPQAPSK